MLENVHEAGWRGFFLFLILLLFLSAFQVLFRARLVLVLDRFFIEH